MPETHPIHGTIYDDQDFDRLVENVAECQGMGGWERPPPGHDPRVYSALMSTQLATIPRSEVDFWINMQERQQSRISDRITWRATDQGSYPTCWAAGTCHALTTARAIRGGSIEMVSPMSVAVPISGGNAGGYEGVAVKWLMEHGGVREDFWRATDRRNYTGLSIDSDRQRLRITEALQQTSPDDFWTACLLGWPSTVAYAAWRHVVMLCDFIRIEPGSYGYRIRNNWGDSWGDKNRHGVGGFAVFREDARIGTPTSGFAIRSVLQSQLEVVAS
jgi:hypothetical protein